jgi:hypothetical protein
MKFRKEHLESRHYNWALNSHIFTGKPSRRIFDRSNGDQVLFIINSYASMFDSFSLEEAKKLEERILHELPIGITSELSVLHWLQTVDVAG